MSTAGIPRSAVRYRPLAESVQEFVVLSPRASKGSPRQRGPRPGRLRLWWQPKSGPPLVLVGVGMLVTVLVLVVSQAVVPWGMKTADDLHYGYPRTTQVDHYVGHEQSSGAPSHFVAMNLHGQITVVEIPGGNLWAAQLLEGPTLVGPGADLAPVTLRFVGDSQHPDLEVGVQSVQVRFHNTGKAYVPAGVTG